MIKIKIEGDKKSNKGYVVLWLDGEFQTVAEGQLVGCKDCMYIKALELEKAIPFATVEIDRDAMITGIPGRWIIKEYVKI